MPPRLKAIVQYAIIIGITVLLVWFSLRGLTVAEGEDRWTYLYNTWLAADKGWLLLMAGIAMISHLIRAERWRMLLEPARSPSTLNESFLSLMVGYLVNLVVPRGGEVSRCYNLHQLNKTPIETSLGTVVVERLLDVVCFALILALAFSLQYDKFISFLDSLPLGANEGSNKLMILGILVAALVVASLAGWFAWRNQKIRERLKKIFDGFRRGLLSIKDVRRPGLFIFYSVFIWILYFIMSYTVMLAFPSTSTLGLGAVLSVFALGSIAMVAPLPGGAGAYHTLVPAGITFLYKIPAPDAIAFVFIFHAWQTFIVVAAGALSMIATSLLSKRK
jgi:glycosyltransferase 2 family protein